MTKQPEEPRPTDAELAILGVLWERGPSTVREVQERLGAERGTGYTTTLKFMQIMFEKGLVRRNDERRSHVYEAVVSQAKTQRRLIRDLVDRAFEGSAQKLVLQALSTTPATRSELDEIRELLDRLSGEQQ